MGHLAYSPDYRAVSLLSFHLNISLSFWLTTYPLTYECYPENNFWWAIKKKHKYTTNHVYCHLMYILYTTFRHSFHHYLGTCHSVAPAEWCRLRCKARGDDFFDLVVVEPPASKEGFKLLTGTNDNHLVLSLGCGGGGSNCSKPNVVMRFCVVAAVCGRALSWNIAVPRLSMPRRLFWIARRNFFSGVDWGALRQEVHKQNAFSVPKHCAHDLPSWSGLLEFNLCWPPLHGLLLQFRGCMRHPCLIPCDYMAQEVIAFLTVSCQKVQRTGLPFQFVFFRKYLWHPACTQFHEEVTVKLEENAGKVM